MLHCDDRDGIRVVRLDHGKVSALDVELLRALENELERGLEDDVKAIVLTGTGSVFSAGVDLFRVLDGGREYLDEFLPALTSSVRRLFEWPRPVVAAVNGHAIAGGCVLTCACDHRVMSADAGTIGLTELLVGVPFPTMVMEVLRARVSPASLAEVVSSGRTFTPHDGLARGLVDELAPADEVVDRALDTARRYAAMPPAAYELTKRQLREPAIERYLARTARDETAIQQLWAAPETAAVMRAFLERTVRRKR